MQWHTMDAAPIGQACEEVQNSALMARVRTEQNGTHDAPSGNAPSNHRRTHCNDADWYAHYDETL